MTWQKHIIKKQLIELQIPEGLDSRDIQNRVSQIFQDKILHEMDKCFNTSSPPGTIDKIDRLELDVGTIHISQLEEALVEKIQVELQHKMSILQRPKVTVPTGKKENNNRKIGSNLDAIAYFLQTGLLPWWIKENNHLAFEQVLRESLVNKPTQLKNLLNELLQNEIVLTRLIYSCSDEILYAILESYMPGAAALIKKHEAQWALQTKGNADAQRLKQQRRLGFFFSAVNKMETAAAFPKKASSISAEQKQVASVLPPGDLEKAALSNKTELPESILIEQVKKAIAAFQAYLTELFATNQRVAFALLPGGSKKSALVVKSEFANSPIQILIDHRELVVKDIKAYLTTVFKNSSGGKDHQPNHKNISAHIKVLQNNIEANKKGVLSKAQKQQIQASFESLASECKILFTQRTHEKATAQITALQHALRDAIALLQAGNETEPLKQAKANARAGLPPFKKQSIPQKKLYDPFSETEKIYIRNAGLVLLWPFLNRFFQNIGLANEKAFVDESAAAKACLMLQYLTGTAPEDMFEAQLPLNKVLCGVDLEEPVNTQWLIEPEEAEAAENFLVAVIQNGPLWKTLSTDGFRQAYLNREGALSTRDGNWLLQVKRETYDVIVDRLPWTIQVVKLPWMKRLIFVEW